MGTEELANASIDSSVLLLFLSQTARRCWRCMYFLGQSFSYHAIGFLQSFQRKQARQKKKSMDRSKCSVEAFIVRGQAGPGPGERSRKTTMMMILLVSELDGWREGRILERIRFHNWWKEESGYAAAVCKRFRILFVSGQDWLTMNHSRIHWFIHPSIHSSIFRTQHDGTNWDRGQHFLVSRVEWNRVEMNFFNLLASNRSSNSQTGRDAMVFTSTTRIPFWASDSSERVASDRADVKTFIFRWRKKNSNRIEPWIVWGGRTKTRQWRRFLGFATLLRVGSLFVSIHTVDLEGMKATWHRDPKMKRFAGCLRPRFSFDAQNDGRVVAEKIPPLGTIVHRIRYFGVEMRTISCDSEDWECSGVEESNPSDQAIATYGIIQIAAQSSILENFAAICGME